MWGIIVVAAGYVFIGGLLTASVDMTWKYFTGKSLIAAGAKLCRYVANETGKFIVRIGTIALTEVGLFENKLATSELDSESNLTNPQRRSGSMAARNENLSEAKDTEEETILNELSFSGNGNNRGSSSHNNSVKNDSKNNDVKKQLDESESKQALVKMAHKKYNAVSTVELSMDAFYSFSIELLESMIEQADDQQDSVKVIKVLADMVYEAGIRKGIYYSMDRLIMMKESALQKLLFSTFMPSEENIEIQPNERSNNKPQSINYKALIDSMIELALEEMKIVLSQEETNYCESIRGGNKLPGNSSVLEVLESLSRIVCGTEHKEIMLRRKLSTLKPNVLEKIYTYCCKVKKEKNIGQGLMSYYDIVVDEKNSEIQKKCYVHLISAYIEVPENKRISKESMLDLKEFIARIGSLNIKDIKIRFNDMLKNEKNNRFSHYGTIDQKIMKDFIELTIPSYLEESRKLQQAYSQELSIDLEDFYTYEGPILKAR